MSPATTHRPPGRPAWPLLAFAAGGGPAAWAAHLGLSYLLVPESCRLGTAMVLHSLTLITAVVALAAVVVAGRTLRAAGEDAVARFVGAVGLVVGGIFVAAILVAGIPSVLIDPCR